MAREIRISIDDDEVFERMKARKHELDLSWEEVLYRGLREESGEGHGPGPGPFQGTKPGPDPHYDERRSTEDPWDRWADDLEASIRRKVGESLRTSFGAAGIDVPEPPDAGLDREVEALSEAEDATLVFDFLGDDEQFQVPLRVNLATGADGLDIEVVAVREGKGVAGTNAFEPGARHTIAERLSTDGLATLRLEAGVEEYDVVPVLSWGRDDRGRPTVTDVEIRDVVFDAER